jgi:4-hydroxy-3-methylbut-2-enyl diphosphate reductase
MSDPAARPSLTIRLASPRGFCAGVDRAIQIVERAIEKYGAPVYVRHEIVHNVHVVERLRRLGAVFVEEVSECPTDRPVIFSAHGAPKAAAVEVGRRNMLYLDATCPLVSKVHLDAERHFEAGREIVLIGHAGHPEVLGTLGQLPEGAITLLETLDDALVFTPRDPANLAYVTQTTLSVDDTIHMVEALKRRFPLMAAPHKEDICYATTNRQEAVKRLSQGCDLVLVVGSQKSSNSLRLVEVALRSGAADARLIDDASGLTDEMLDGVSLVGLTAGASAPEVLVQGVLDALAVRFDVTIQEDDARPEGVVFKLPRALVAQDA